MTNLLAMCFDSASSPSIRLEPPSGEERRSAPRGWGFAWYPAEDKGAAVVKDPNSLGDNSMTRLLSEWKRFRSSIFVCHFLGPASRRTQQDTHPFVRTFAKSSWTFAHNGDLNRGYAARLPLGEAPTHEPLGRTDSEYTFCWLLNSLHARRARCMADVPWATLHQWFRTINNEGTANFIFSDGQELVAYHDATQFGSLYWIRRTPPHENWVLGDDKFEIDLSDALDVNRSMIVVATKPLSDEEWTPMQAGQMLVFKGGAVVWDSHIGQRSSISVSNASCELPAPAEPETRVLQVTHNTYYKYHNPVELSTHLLHFRPVFDDQQQVLEHSLTIKPEGIRRDLVDVFGNWSTRLEVEEEYTEMRIECRSVVRLTRDPSIVASARQTLPMVWMPWQRALMQPYLLPMELPESQLQELSEFALTFARRQDNDLFDTIADMNKTIYKDFQYIPGSTTLETTPFDVYVKRHGVCQDFANLLICLARLLNIPARYRVGYIFTGGNYENKIQSDASHAWVEVYLPQVGWRGFDPTNGCVANLDHIRIACGRNYRDATPTAGTIYRGGGSEGLSIDVKVLEIPDPALKG